jgi:hypothetical protein
VEWEVNSPGGRCEWGGDLFDQSGSRLHSGRSSELAPGRRKVSLFFDGTAIAAAASHEWKVEAGFRCEGVPARAALVGLPVQVNSGEYEALPENVLFGRSQHLG